MLPSSQVHPLQSSEQVQCAPSWDWRSASSKVDPDAEQPVKHPSPTVAASSSVRSVPSRFPALMPWLWANPPSGVKARCARTESRIALEGANQGDSVRATPHHGVVGHARHSATSGRCFAHRADWAPPGRAGTWRRPPVGGDGVDAVGRAGARAAPASTRPVRTASHRGAAGRRHLLPEPDVELPARASPARSPSALSHAHG